MVVLILKMQLFGNSEQFKSNETAMLKETDYIIFYKFVTGLEIMNTRYEKIKLGS